MEPEAPLGMITIAPEVIVTLIRLTALQTPGVVRMSTDWMGNVNRILGRTSTGGGVRIELEGDSVTVDLHIIADPTTNLYRLGQTLQREITRAVQEMIGLQVKEVNIHIEDVALPQHGEWTTASASDSEVAE